MPDLPSSDSQNARASRVGTYIVTNGTKVVGLYLIVAEARSDQPTRDSILLAGAALALGAQAVEDIILRIVDRIFGGDGGSQ